MTKAKKPKSKKTATSKKAKETDSRFALDHKKRQEIPEIELDAMLHDVALRPKGISYDEIATKYNITRGTLFKYRREHADRIDFIQAEFFTEAKAEVMKALIDSATGPMIEFESGFRKGAPNPKSIEFFFDLDKRNMGEPDSDPFRLFDTYWPLEKQAQFLYAGDPTGALSTVLLITGIGYGKTKTLPHKVGMLARRNRGCQGMIVAPTYKMLQNPLMDYLIKSFAEMGIKVRHRKADGELELWGDTTILLRSADNPDNLRGPNLAWVVGDELRNWTEEAFRVCIGRIRDPKARFRQFAGTSTPFGFNWLHRLTEKADANEAGNVQVFFARTEENIYLPADFAKQVRALYDEDYILQELEGKFINIGTGQIYHKFNRAVNVVKCELDPSLPIWIGQDFNVNPMASVIMQPRTLPSGVIAVHVVDELSIRGTIHDTIKELEERGLTPERYGERLEIYPDASGENNSAAATRSPIEVFRERGFTLRHQRANPFVRDRYASVNGKLCNADGDSTLFVDPRCKNLINDLEREVYAEGMSVREKTRDGAKHRGHWADALGYAIHVNFNIESAYNFNYHSL